MIKYRRLLIDFIKGDVGYEAPFYVVLLLVSILVIGAFFSTLLDQDEMIYALVAIDILDGKLPYQGTFDHKPVGIYYVYAAFFSVFGENFIAIRIMTVSLLLGAAVCLFVGLKRLSFSHSAIFFSITTCMAFPLGVDGLSGNTEGIQTFILAIVFLLSVLILDKRIKYKSAIAVFYGVLVAFGFAVNYLFSFLGLFAFLSLFLFMLTFGYNRLSAFVIGFLVFSGFFCGSLMIYFPYILDFVNGGNLINEYLSEQMDFLESYGAGFNKKLVINRLFDWVIPFAPVIVSGVFMFYWLSKDKKIVGFFSIATFLSACIAASASMMFFNHYWILSTVPLALLAAVATESAKDLQSNFIIRYGHSAVLLVFLVSGSGRIVNHVFNIGAERELKQANEFIQKNIGPMDTVVTISASPVYVFLNKLNTDQKYHFQGHVEQLHNAGVLDGDDYFVRLLNNHPRYTLIDPVLCDGSSNDIFINTCEYIEYRYKLISSFQGVRPVSIYERVDDLESIGSTEG